MDAEPTPREIFEAAAALLDAVDARLAHADAELVSYDHAASATVCLVAGCLAVADEEPAASFLLLKIGAELLEELQPPVLAGALQLGIRAKLRALGYRQLPPALALVVDAA